MELTKNAPAASASPLSALITMFYEPTKTFEQLEPRPRAWVPLVLLIVSSLMLMAWFFAKADVAWVIDQIIAGMSTAEERDAAAKFMTPAMMQTSSFVFSLVMFPVMFALMGLYLMVTSKAVSHGLTFGKSFALAAWASVPALLMLPLGGMQIMLSSTGQISLEQLNPLSLNQLLFHYDLAHPLAGILNNLNLMTFWTMFLLVIGFEVWAKVKRATAIKVVVIPHLIFFGGFIVYGMSKIA